MGQFSVEKPVLPGSVLSGNQQNERRYGKFERSFLVPEGADVDAIAARFADGVLTVTLPKNPAARKTERAVEIASG